MTDRVWAPWRMQYLLDPKPAGGCVLCRYASEPPSRDSLVLFQGTHAYVVLNKYPYTAGHVMIVPRQHTSDIGALATEQHGELWSLVREAVLRLKSAVAPDGMNVGMNLGRPAGAGIDDHLHAHVVPRWNGDNSFIAVVGETRVMNEHLAATWDRLAPAFEDLSP